MNFLMFNVISTVENAAAIIMLLSMFKYRITDYLPQILLTSLTMSLISHTMRVEFDNSSLVPIISIITLFLFMWITFNVAVVYAAFISSIGFITFGLMEALLLYVFYRVGFLNQDKVEHLYSLQGYILQLSAAALAGLISFLLRRKNWGFNWIPYSPSAKFKLKGSNILSFVLLLISVFLVGLVFFLTLTGYMQLVSYIILIFIVAALLFYLAKKQEDKYYD